MIEEAAARQWGRLSDAPFLALGEEEREWRGGGRRLLWVMENSRLEVQLQEGQGGCVRSWGWAGGGLSPPGRDVGRDWVLIWGQEKDTPLCRGLTLPGPVLETGACPRLAHPGAYSTGAGGRPSAWDQAPGRAQRHGLSVARSRGAFPVVCAAHQRALPTPPLPSRPAHKGGPASATPLLTSRLPLALTAGETEGLCPGPSSSCILKAS